MAGSGGAHTLLFTPRNWGTERGPGGSQDPTDPAPFAAQKPQERYSGCRGPGSVGADPPRGSHARIPQVRRRLRRPGERPLHPLRGAARTGSPASPCWHARWGQPSHSRPTRGQRLSEPRSGVGTQAPPRTEHNTTKMDPRGSRCERMLGPRAEPRGLPSCPPPRSGRPEGTGKVVADRPHEAPKVRLAQPLPAVRKGLSVLGRSGHSFKQAADNINILHLLINT